VPSKTAGFLGITANVCGGHPTKRQQLHFCLDCRASHWFIRVPDFPHQGWWRSMTAWTSRGFRRSPGPTFGLELLRSCSAARFCLRCSATRRCRRLGTSLRAFVLCVGPSFVSRRMVRRRVGIRCPMSDADERGLGRSGALRAPSALRSGHRLSAVGSAIAAACSTGTLVVARIDRRVAAADVDHLAWPACRRK
jgi:hypothetical protein